MKPFARFSAIVFLVIGIIIILTGVFMAISGFFSSKDVISAPSLVPDLSGLVMLGRVILGITISMQGFFLAAIGQVLWLLAEISDETHKTSEYLGFITRRTNQQKQ
jgi:uncharacterized membrane protein